MDTTTTRSLIRIEDVDNGKHKHGGTIKAVRLSYSDGTGELVNLGVIKRMPAFFIQRYGKDQSYLVNDWTAPDFVDGVRNADKAQTFATRARAMKHLHAIRTAIVLSRGVGSCPTR